MSRVAVAGPSSTVTEAAGRVVEAGGSVVDAAIVAALVAMCTEPGICAPAGGGFLTVCIPGADPVVVDGYMAYPGIGFDGEQLTRSVTMTYGGGVTTLVGPGSIAVPGAFAAFALASRRFGSVPWRVLMDVAAETVAAGFPLGQAAHTYLTHAGRAIFADDPVVRGALFDGGRLRDPGELIVVAGLADTLRHIGEEGATAFYEGDLARDMVSDLAGRGSKLTLEDLSSYRAEVRAPIDAAFGAWTFWLNPPPAIGGAMVARALAELARSASPGPESWTGALVTAFAARRDHLGSVPDPAGATGDAVAPPGMRAPSTISVAACDDSGGAVAGTFSAGYGSGVVPRGTGLMMNNALGELELLPDEQGDVEPGRRMISNMAPTVGKRGGDVVAMGSPGAERITSALFSTIASLAGGLGLAEAIDHPRLHPELDHNGVRVAVEPGLDLPGSPYPLKRYDRLDMFFGGVNGAAIEGGRLTAHADIRRSGAVGIFG